MGEIYLLNPVNYDKIFQFLETGLKISPYQLSASIGDRWLTEARMSCLVVGDCLCYSWSIVIVTSCGRYLLYCLRSVSPPAKVHYGMAEQCIMGRRQEEVNTCHKVFLAQFTSDQSQSTC